MIKAVDEPAEVTTKEKFSYPTTEQYIKKLKLKEVRYGKLNKNEQYWKRLMTLETEKVDFRKDVNVDTHKS